MGWEQGQGRGPFAYMSLEERTPARPLLAMLEQLRITEGFYAPGTAQRAGFFLCH